MEQNVAKVLELIQNQLKDMQSDIKNMKTDMQDMKTDMQDMKTDMQDVKTDMQDMKTDMQYMKTDMQVVKTDMQDMKTDIKDLQRNQIRFDNELRNVHILIENDILRKIDLLYENRDVVLSRIEKIDRMSKTEEDVSLFKIAVATNSRDIKELQECKII